MRKTLLGDSHSVYSLQAPAACLGPQRPQGSSRPQAPSLIFSPQNSKGPNGPTIGRGLYLYLVRILLQDAPDGVAHDLLRTPEDELDVTSLKTKHLFTQALEQAAQDGTASPELYAFALPLKLKFKAPQGRITPNTAFAGQFLFS